MTTPPTPFPSVVAVCEMESDGGLMVSLLREMLFKDCLWETVRCKTKSEELAERRQKRERRSHMGWAVISCLPIILFMKADIVYEYIRKRYSIISLLLMTGWVQTKEDSAYPHSADWRTRCPCFPLSRLLKRAGMNYTPGSAVRGVVLARSPSVCPQRKSGTTTVWLLPFLIMCILLFLCLRWNTGGAELSTCGQRLISLVAS